MFMFPSNKRDFAFTVQWIPYKFHKHAFYKINQCIWCIYQIQIFFKLSEVVSVWPDWPPFHVLCSLYFWCLTLLSSLRPLCPGIAGCWSMIRQQPGWQDDTRSDLIQALYCVPGPSSSVYYLHETQMGVQLSDIYTVREAHLCVLFITYDAKAWRLLS